MKTFISTFRLFSVPAPLAFALCLCLSPAAFADEGARTCAGCNYENPPASLFCGKCGAYLKGTPASSRPAPPAFKIAVLQFKSHPKLTRYVSETGLADILISRLQNIPRLSIISRSELDALLFEKNLAKQGIVDADDAFLNAKLTGVDFLVVGSVADFSIEERDNAFVGIGKIAGGVRTRSTRVNLDLIVKALDARSGEIAWTKEVKHSEKSSGATLAGGELGKFTLGGVKIGDGTFQSSMVTRALDKALGEQASHLAAFFRNSPPPQLPPPGPAHETGSPQKDAAVEEKNGRQPVQMAGAKARVIGVAGDLVFLELGELARGMGPGDMIAISRVAEVKNKSGKTIWLDEEEIGAAEVLELKDTKAKARIKDSTQTVREGDVGIKKRK